MSLRKWWRRTPRPAAPRPVLQEHFFRQALAEVGLPPDGIAIDHHAGRCFHPELGEVPIVFPRSLLRRIEQIPKVKSQEAFFSGVITAERAWLHSYDGVRDSAYGRDPATKYEFHAEYYAGLCGSRFGLAPVGDCPWSYRFFEAIMCSAIPVLGDLDEDIHADAFVHYRHSDSKRWLPEWCATNYDRLLRDHTLAGLRPDLAARSANPRI